MECRTAESARAEVDGIVVMDRMGQARLRGAVLVGLLVSSLVALGCAPGYAPLPDRMLPESEVTPHPTEMEGDPLRVVLGIEVPAGFEDALDAESDLLREIVKFLDGTGVDARMNTQDYSVVYKDAIALAERKSNEVYGGSQRVSYVVQGRLNESSFERIYKKPLWYPGADEDRPGKCVNEARISLALEAISLPRVRRAKKWVLSASDDASFEANGDCQRPERPGTPAQKRDEVRRSVLDTIAGCLEGPLRQFFAPRAYVDGYQSDGESHFFSISGGSASGFDAGDAVELERLLPADKGGGATRVAEGRVTREIRERSAFVRVRDAEEAAKVQKGDRVRVSVRNLRAPLCAFNLEEH